MRYYLLVLALTLAACSDSGSGQRTLMGSLADQLAAFCVENPTDPACR